MRSLRNVLAVLFGLILSTLPDVTEAGRRLRLVPCQPVAANVPASEPTPADPVVSSPAVIRSREVHTQTVRECDGTTCRTRTVNVQRSSEAQRRAEQLAQREQLGHFWVVSTYEGVGMGASPDQAKAACCYWGQRTPSDIGIAQGSSGRWYAVVHYN